MWFLSKKGCARNETQHGFSSESIENGKSKYIIKTRVSFRVCFLVLPTEGWIIPRKIYIYSVWILQLFFWDFCFTGMGEISQRFVRFFCDFWIIFILFLRLVFVHFCYFFQTFLKFTFLELNTHFSENHLWFIFPSVFMYFHLE